MSEPTGCARQRPGGPPARQRPERPSARPLRPPSSSTLGPVAPAGVGSSPLRPGRAVPSRIGRAAPTRPLAEVLDAYRAHLGTAPLAASTRLAYARHVRRYLAWLEARPAEERSGALGSPAGRDWAVRDWRRQLVEVDRLAPASVNAALAAVDDLYRHLGLGPARRVTRQRLAAAAPRALGLDELRRLLRAVEARGNARDRAVIALMAFAGLRVSEVAALERADVSLTARTGRVVVRSGKGGQSRAVPLPAEARAALGHWLAGHPGTAALFPGPDGAPLSVRSLHRAVRAAGGAAGLAVSPHVLRHTFVTRLVRRGTDLPLVADLAGHRRLETTRRYALPSDADRQEVIETLALDY